MADTFKLLRVAGRWHVIGQFYRGDTRFGLPNYRNSGCALIGILDREPSTKMCYAKTLKEFKAKWIKSQMKLINTEE